MLDSSQPPVPLDINRGRFVLVESRRPNQLLRLPLRSGKECIVNIEMKTRPFCPTRLYIATRSWLVEQKKKCGVKGEYGCFLYTTKYKYVSGTTSLNYST